MATTLHSIERAKERCNFKNEKSAMRNIGLAIERGKRAEDCTSWEREYLRAEGYDGCCAIAYNGFCYIVNELEICVTIHSLPGWFGKKKNFDGKKRIRDPKKYCRGNAEYLARYEAC